MSEVDVPDARESYRPSRAAPTAKIAFAQWTDRVAAGLPDLVTSRDLAGLSDEQLTALVRQFEEAPRYKRDDIFRFSFTVSGLLAMAGAGFAYSEATALIRVAGLTPLAVGAWTSFGAAFVALCAGTWTKLRLVPNQAAYAKVGLLVGALNEQHPWLYNAYFALRNPAALAHRDKVLRERGPIRGMDYLLMRQVSELEEKIQVMQNTRTVVAAVQGESEVLPAATHASPSVVQLAPSAAAAPGPILAGTPGKVLTLGAHQGRLDGSQGPGFDS